MKKGNKMSEEAKKKLSSSMKAKWELRKANKKKGFIESFLQIFRRKG